MKKITLLFIFFFALAGYAQTKGITYQAVILNPTANQTRGVGQNLPLMDKQICMSFKFTDEFSNVEYQETVQAKTDAYGMVNLIIGSGQQTGGYASSFSDISWSTLNKKLAVGINTNGSCTTFMEISNQDFSFVPFAHAATNAENVTGVVSLENGGTNATTVIQAKTNLELQNVNNTSDASKPLSIAAQTALNSKVDRVVGKGLSTEDYSAAEKAKLGAISGTNTGDQDLSSYATNTDVASKVDKVAGKGLSTEDYSNAEKTKLGAISGTNTGDQDLSSYATNTDLASKADKVAGKGLSTEDYSTSEKAKLGAISGANTGDQDLSSFATNTALASKVDKVAGKGLSTEDYSTAEKTKLGAISGTNTGDQDLSSYATSTNLASKVDKVAGKGLSTEDYSTAEKTKLGAISGTNTGDQDLSSYATSTNLASKVDKVAGKGLSTEDYSTAEKAKLGATLGTNTGDQDLSSFGTNTDLASKVDKVVGKGLSTEDYSTAEKAKLGVILGTNTGDQDLSNYATNTALKLKANIDSPTFTGTPIAPTATASTSTTQIATTEYVTDAISTSSNKFLPLVGGTLTGEIIGTSAAFTSNVKASSLTLSGSRIWELSPFGAGVSLVQGGCCRRFTIDEEGRFAIGANYDPSYQLDVQGDGRFTSDVTATAFKILNGTASQFLKADGSIDSRAYVTTDAAANFVDLNSDQLIGGGKSFSSNLWVNGVSMGKNGSQSLFIGEAVNNGPAENATAIGFMTLDGNDGSNNTAVGTNSMRNSGSTSNNTAIGINAGSGSNTGGSNTFIGKDANVNYNTPSISNSTAVGNSALVLASNTIQLGNSAITDIKTSGVYTGSGFKTIGGVSSEFLKADGTADTNTYALLASPTFTGIPVAPTATADTNSDQIATTAFVTSAISETAIPDATSSVKGKIQLAGDLTGTADSPAIATDAITSDKIKDGEIVNEDISASAAIEDTKLATITTAGKVNNSATTATALSTGYSIVARDVYGSFAAGNITAAGLSSSNNIQVSGTSIGSFGAANTGNIGFGIANYVYGDTSTMYNNTAIGNFAFTSSSGSNNTAIGTNAIRQGDGGSGDENTAVGIAALTNAQAGNRNTAVGAFTMTQAVGSENTAIGNLAGMNISTGSYNTFLGSGTGIDSVVNGSINNATAIGSGTKVDTSNTIVLGNVAITDVITNGKITTGAITIPNTDGDAGQVLSTNGSGVVSWTTPATASSSTFVDLTSNQNISGNKVFEKDAVINGVTVGRGKFNENSNTAVGLGALENNEGYANTAVGRGALASNVSNGGNTALGYIALVSNTSGSDNVAVGSQALETNISGSFNTAIGKRADVSSDGISNSVAIGANAFVTASNTIQLGSDGSGSYPAITNVNTSGVIKSGSVTYPNTHNSISGQVLTMSVSGLASWENNIQYKQVILSDNTNDQTPVTVGGLSIRVNNKILEISRVTNSDPSSIGVYATVYNGNSGAFNANPDGSGGPVTPKFGTTIANANMGTWSSLLDDANGVKQEIGTYYFKLEADLSVYDSSKTYKLTVLSDGWGKVIMRLIYYPE
jgi:hypothetical protein